MIKKAIITGATGFVGSNLCRNLVELNWEVSIITRPSSDYTNISEVLDKVKVFKYDGDIHALINFFKDTKADVVFHLASLCINDHKPDQIDNLIDSNIRFGLHVLEAMKESETELLINTGTSWQYYHTDEYNPVNLYAASKQAFGNIIKYYCEAENIRALTLLLFDTYGEVDSRPKLINLLRRHAENGMQLKMSPGEQRIDLVHVDDVVRAYLEAYAYLNDSKLIKYDEFGVGSGKTISVKTLVLMFEEATNKKMNVSWGGRPYRKREAMKPWNGYNKLPNWECQIKLEEGLRRMRNNTL